MKTTSTILLFGAALAVATFTGASRADTSAAPVAKVSIANMAFSPSTLTVTAGTTVTWVNRDGDAHSVESRDKGFTSSPLLNTGDKYSYTFTTPGTYTYYCGVHASMTGKIVVTAPEPAKD
jgi:plastocyanin